MADKVTFSVYADRALVDRFREVASHFDGRMGLLLSAAMVQWMETDPQVQGDYIRRVFDAQLRDEVASLVEATKRELARQVGQSGEHAGKSKSKGAGES